MRAALLAAVVVAGTLTGCAGDYVSRTSAVRDRYQANEYDEALALLEKQAAEGRAQDRLLYLLDRGMILHAAGRHAESAEVLLEAEKVAESLDIVSVSEEARTLLSNERKRAYRGEDFERLLINVINALNFAALGERDEALVEIRRAHERLRRMVDEEDKPYRQLAIARYLGGLLYEAAGELDSAYIDYRKALEHSPDLELLAEPALRLALMTGRDEAYEALAKAYPELTVSPLAEDEGWVVVVVEAGLSPEKRASTTQRQHEGEVDALAIPVYRERTEARRAVVHVGEDAHPAVTVTAVGEVAQLHLRDRIGRMLARSMASGVAKAGVAAVVGAVSKSKDAGLLTFYLLMLANAPDLRSWLSLPAEFQVARLRLPEGEHEVAVEWNGERSTHPVRVEAGGVSFVVVRRY